MADILPLFLKGMKDSLRLKQGILDVLSSYELTKRTLQITGINGVIYLGSIYLYNFFIQSSIFSSDAAVEPKADIAAVYSIFVMALKLVMTLAYNVWIFIIYIIAMTLTTFWV